MELYTKCCGTVGNTQINLVYNTYDWAPDKANLLWLFKTLESIKNVDKSMTLPLPYIHQRKLTYRWEYKT
jgi:hypothetical protein